MNICKWIITNTHKIQTCKRERRESAERHRGVRRGCLHSDSALSMLTDLGQLNLPSLNPGVFQKRLKMIMPTSSNLLIKLHTHTHTPPSHGWQNRGTEWIRNEQDHKLVSGESGSESQSYSGLCFEPQCDFCLWGEGEMQLGKRWWTPGERFRW